MKAVLTIITKLADRTVNGELLKYLAKTANDEQPGIRTNTTICLGKIARNLGPNVMRQRYVDLVSEANGVIDTTKGTDSGICPSLERSIRACTKCSIASLSRHIRSVF